MYMISGEYGYQRESGILRSFLAGASVLAACSGGCGISLAPDPAIAGRLAVIASDNAFVGESTIADISRIFFDDHEDEFDMLVLWGTRSQAPGNAFYLSVSNDVAGIGYGNVGPEFFDNAEAFGSRSLQGIIWMGPDWIENAAPSGPESVLGILAQETAHRWGATIRFHSEETKDASDELLGSRFHWSFLLNSGASPLGGNAWEPLGDGIYRAEPVSALDFSPLDLYLMGLIAVDETGPIQLLTNARDVEIGGGLFSPFGDRVSHPVTLRADLVEVSIDQVIAVEGLRDPEVGSTAARIRQAWIVVADDPSILDAALSTKLLGLASEWPSEFERMTGGRGTVIVTTR